MVRITDLVVESQLETDNLHKENLVKEARSGPIRPRRVILFWIPIPKKKKNENEQEIIWHLNISDFDFKEFYSGR